MYSSLPSPTPAVISALGWLPPCRLQDTASHRTAPPATKEEQGRGRTLCSALPRSWDTVSFQLSPTRITPGAAHRTSPTKRGVFRCLRPKGGCERLARLLQEGNRSHGQRRRTKPLGRPWIVPQEALPFAAREAGHIPAPLIGEQPAGELRQGTMAAPRTASTKGSEEETKPQDIKKLLLRSLDPASRSAQLNHISQQETATTQDKPKNPQHLPRRTPSTASLSRVPARHLRVCSVPITATRARHTPQRLAQQARLGELWPEENHLVAFSPSFPGCYSTAELQ